MGIESIKSSSQPEEDANEDEVEPVAKSPSRRRFLGAAGKLALGAIAASVTRSESPINEQHKRPENTPLTEAILQGALRKIQQEKPGIWRQVIGHKIERGTGRIEHGYEKYYQNQRARRDGKLGAAVGIAGIDLVSPHLRIWRQYLSGTKNSETSRQSTNLNRVLEDPLNVIAGELKAFATNHLQRSLASSVSGGLTMLVSKELRSPSPEDPAIRKDAIEMAKQTLIPDESSAHPEDQQFRETMFHYILRTTNVIQPWLKKNSIHDPIDQWGAGSYVVAREIAAQGWKENQTKNEPEKPKENL